MSKATGSKREKSRRSKRARDVAVRDAAPTAAAGRQPAPVVSPPAPGQRLYDMPYSSPAPRLVNPELGLEHLVARAGHNAGYEIDLTLLDAPDHRLMRSGVLLAHRVLEGRGEWYLGAPDWVPLLPKELIESMGQAELTDDMADLIRPFRRRAPLTPVAALRCERREFALRAAQGGATVALLRDDKVTVRRSGLTTARYREVMLTPVGPGLDQDQAEWLDQCLSGAGATVLRSLPAIGLDGSERRPPAPPTSQSRQPFDPQAPFSTFVSSLLALRLRQLLAADLRLRSGDQAAAADLVAAVGSLRWELDGLRTVLDEEWTADLLDELEWVAADLSDPDPTGDDLAAGPTTGRPTRAVSGISRCSTTSWSPHAGDGSATSEVGPPEPYSMNSSTRPLARINRITGRLAVDGPARVWDEAWAELQRSQTVDHVVEHLDPDRIAERRRRLARCLPLLEQVRAFNASAVEVLEGVDDLTPAEAFALGREFERSQENAAAARAAFLVCWAKVARKLATWRSEGDVRRAGRGRRRRQVHPAESAMRLVGGAGRAGGRARSSRATPPWASRFAGWCSTRRPANCPPGRRPCCTPPTRRNTSTRVIRPALQSGAVVVSDRYVDSMIAYQGAGRAMSPAEVEEVARWATEHLHPDLTVVLDSEPGRAVGVISDKDRLEGAGDVFHQRVRQHFLTLAARDPDRYLVLDASRSRADLAADIQARVAELLSYRPDTLAR